MRVRPGAHDRASGFGPTVDRRGPRSVGTLPRPPGREPRVAGRRAANDHGPGRRPAGPQPESRVYPGRATRPSARGHRLHDPGHGAAIPEPGSPTELHQWGRQLSRGRLGRLDQTRGTFCVSNSRDMARTSGGAPYTHLELFRDGRKADEELRWTTAAPTHLQVERRGDSLFLRTSADGRAWTDFKACTVPGMPPKVLVGVAVINSEAKEFSAQFEDWSLRSAGPASPESGLPGPSSAIAPDRGKGFGARAQAARRRE